MKDKATKMRHIDRYIWDRFCQQYKKTEKGMKSFLFKEKLSEKEFETLIDCSRYAFTDFAYYYIDYGKLFTSCPRLIECCNWTRLDELSWTVLLSQKPEFADKCNKWDEFDGDDWSDLLAKQPQFADKCAWDKFDGRAWSRLLEEQPQFADKCNWDSLKGFHWSCLLVKQPQFADKCAWGKFVGLAWSRLLEEQPQFADKCDKWDEFYGDNWGCLLAKQPQFADKCDWNKLDGSAWRYLLSERPQFADKCDKWDEFYGNDWSCLLAKQPQFADKCDWDSLKGLDWSCLLAKQPQFADKCAWDKFDDVPKGIPRGHAWSILLEEQPQFADKCDVWDYLDAVQWRSLLKHQPQLVDKCAKSSIVVNVLIKHPQFTEHCNTSIITEKGKAKLLAKHPDLVKYFPKKTETKVPKKKQIKNKLVALLLENENAEVSSEEYEKFTGSDWGQLLSEKPQFADKCNKWNDFPHWTLTSLLKKHPELAKYFQGTVKTTEKMDEIEDAKIKKMLQALNQNLQAETIGLDSEKYMYWKNYCKERGFEDVQSAIRTLFKDVTSKEIPNLTDKLSLGGFYFDYYWLFDEFPEFIQRCNWDMLNSNDWKELLRFKPEFSDKCDWSKLKACDWSELLVDQPQFADKCDKWDDFDDMDWWYLLDTQPQFADKCDWSKLDSLDTYHWSELLQEQPQFADECNKWDEFNENEKEELIDAHPNLAKYFK